ncbi:MAG: ligase-associated DNA damage response exonuclease [Cyclobacteriaceae bacterium]|nr:ligase-associated DNA damage response exonuclease [Cyclobacteriaceae bacterium]MCH8516567.1 ligase-associated DNA damage response exonuclease [Cyclobacteriaceae bacterium]
MARLLEFRPSGIYCPLADVFIDPWYPEKKALITHAHADHSRYGHQHYLAHYHSESIMKQRLGDISFQGVAYHEKININGVNFTFIPAGHIYGSAQILVEHKGERWGVSGDYKVENDGISQAWEPAICDHFITECTFGLPIYKWDPQEVVFDEINQWWQANASQGICSIITAYALGKAQRIMEGIDPSIGPVYLHGAVYNATSALRADGAQLRDFPKVEGREKKDDYRGALIIATPAALGSAWVNKFKPFRTAMASGWMRIRGNQRRRAADRGFVLSDHVDWDGMMKAIKASGAQYIYPTHGNTATVAKYLNEIGYHAQEVQTLFEGESE